MIIALVKHLLLLTFFETLYVFCKNGPKFCQLGIPLFQKHQNFLYIWSFSAKNLQYFIYPELILHNWSHSKYVHLPTDRVVCQWWILLVMTPDFQILLLVLIFAPWFECCHMTVLLLFRQLEDYWSKHSWKMPY